MANTPQNSESKLPDAPVAAPAKPARTHGDKLFDRWIYAGLNGVGTFILTIPLAYWGDHGGGKAFFKKCASYLEKWGADPKNAETAVRATTLGIGGTVMILPVYVAEHFRKPIVTWFNQHFGSDKDKKTVVENPAPQTFGSILKGRLVAWCAVFSGFKLMGALSKWLRNPAALGNFETIVGEEVCKRLGDKPTHNVAAMEKAIAEETKKNGAALTKEAMNEIKVAHETKMFSYGKLGALDVFATAAATSILYVTSRIFAKQRAQKAQLASEKPSVTREAVVPMADATGDAPPTLNASQPESTISGERHAAGMVAPREMQQVHA